MALEFWVVDKEQDGIYDRYCIREDVHDVQNVSEVKFLFAICEI